MWLLSTPTQSRDIDPDVPPGAPSGPGPAACCAGAEAAEARPVLLLHCKAELLSSRWTSDAGHHPALQAGETAHQLALLGLHHWCTAVLSAPREGPAGGVLCTAHLAELSLHACRGLSTVITSCPLGLTTWAPLQTSIQSVHSARARNHPYCINPFPWHVYYSTHGRAPGRQRPLHWPLTGVFSVLNS